MQAAVTTDAGPIMRSKALDESLARAHQIAVAQGHASVTLEHLLFSLQDDPDGQSILATSGIQRDRLAADVSAYLGRLSNGPQLTGSPQPGPDLLRILQLAAMAARQSQRRHIDGAIVLAAIIGDGNSPAAGMLKAQGLTFDTVIKAIAQIPARPPDAVAGPAIATALPAPSPLQSGAEASAARIARVPDAPSADSVLAAARARVKKSEPQALTISPARATPVAAPQPLEPPAPAATPSALETSASAAASPAVLQPHGLAVGHAAHAPPAMPAAVPQPVPQPRSPAAQPAVPAVASPPLAPPAPAPTALPLDEPLATQPTLADLRRLRVGHQPPPLEPPRPSTAAPPSLAPPDQPSPEPTAVVAPPSALRPPVAPFSGVPIGRAPQTETPQRLVAPHVAAPPQLRPPAMTLPLQPGYNPAQPEAPLALTPSVVVDIVAAAAGLPAALRVGTPTLVEVRVPRDQIDVPRRRGQHALNRSAEIPVYRVVSVRLGTGGISGIAVEPRSPETIWIGMGRDFDAHEFIWQFVVTPTLQGRFAVTLSISGRTVSPYGVSGDDTPQSETFAVIVRRPSGSRIRRALVAMGLIGIGAATAALAGGPIADMTKRLLSSLLT